MPATWTIQSPEAMIKLGAAFGRALESGAVFLLRGQLGAGKTQFVKGLAIGLDVQSIVNSPTFTIVKPHEGRLKLQHVDLYRLECESDCEELGINDLIDDTTVLAVEWPERFPSLDSEGAFDVEIGFAEQPDTRTVHIRGDSVSEEGIVEAVASQTGVVIK